MSKPLRVAFFGASVTEQSIHHATGEITGYVSYFEKFLAPQRDYQVFRVSAGSCHLTDAAMVYLNNIIEYKPDICVIDWATSAITECDQRFIDQLYNSLISSGIITMTVILPRVDRAQSETQIAAMMRQTSEKFGMPFHDISSMIADEEIPLILRDIVHTSAKGAKRYAELIDGFIAEIDASSYSFPSAPIPFFVTEIVSPVDAPLSTKQIVVSASSGAHSDLEYCVMLQQRIGPYSPVLEILLDSPGDARRLENFSLWDPWCYRERQCLKPLMGWAAGPFSRITFKVSADNPNYAASSEQTYAEPGSRHIKPRGSLYVVSTRPVECSVHYR